MVIETTKLVYLLEVQMQGMININFQIKSKTYFNFTTIINSE